MNDIILQPLKKTSAAAEALVERLRHRMEECHMNARELAEKAEVGRSFVYDVLSGKSTNPTTQKLSAVARVLGVSVSYLLYGESVSGSGPVAEQVTPEARDVASIASIAVEASMGGGTLVTEEIEDKPFFFRKSWIRDRLKVTPQDLRVIRVRGDSMQPTMNDGDVVLVDLTRNLPSPPGIFVLFDGHGLMVKRLEMLPGSSEVRVISDNPHYAPYSLASENVRVIGRVVWCAREMM